MTQGDLDIKYPQINPPPPYSTIQGPPPPYEAPSSGNRINWNGRDYQLNPKWYQEEKVTRVAGWLLLGASVAAGVATKVASVSFTAKPIIVLYTVGGLAATTVALALAGVVCLLKQCWNDPRYVAKQGEKAEKEILKNKLSFQEIQGKYAKFHFNDEDYNRLFRERIFDEPYDSVKKQITGADGHFGFVPDDSNTGMLRSKLLRHLHDHYEYQLNDDEKTTLKVTDEDLVHIICDHSFYQLQQGKMGYGEFLKKAGHLLNRYLPAALAEIKGKALEFYVAENLGLIEAVNRPDAKQLQITMKELVEAGALKSDLEALPKKGYAYFRNRHSTAAFMFVDKEILKNAYLSSYHVMREFKADAPLFGLEPETMLKERVDSEMKKIHSWQELLDTLGTTVFADGYISKTDSRLRTLILKYLKEKSYHVSDAHLKSALPQDISQKVDQAVIKEKGVLKSFDAEKGKIDKGHQEVVARIDAEHKLAMEMEFDPIQAKVNGVNGEIRQLVEALETTRNSIRLCEELLGKYNAVNNQLSHLVLPTVLSFREMRDLEARKQQLAHTAAERKPAEAQLETLKQIAALDAEILLLVQREKGESRAPTRDVKSVDQLSKELRELTAKREALAEKAKLAAQIPHLKAEIGQLAEGIKKLQINEAHRTDKKIDLLQKELKEKTSRRETLIGRAELAAQIPAIKEEIIALEGTIQKTNEQIKAIKEGPVTGLTAALSAEKRAGELEKELQKTISNKDKLVAKLLEAQQIPDLKPEIAALDAEIQKIKDQIAVKQQEKELSEKVRAKEGLALRLQQAEQIPDLNGEIAWLDLEILRKQQEKQLLEKSLKRAELEARAQSGQPMNIAVLENKLHQIGEAERSLAIVTRQLEEAQKEARLYEQRLAEKTELQKQQREITSRLGGMPARFQLVQNLANMEKEKLLHQGKAEAWCEDAKGVKMRLDGECAHKKQTAEQEYQGRIGAWNTRREEAKRNLHAEFAAGLI